VRIAWVKINGLWPLTTGGRLRTFNILAELAQRHEIRVFTTHGADDDHDTLRKRLGRCSVVSVALKPPRRGTAAYLGTAARAAACRDPFGVSRWRSPALREAVAKCFDEGWPDVCVADFLVAAPAVRLGGGTPVVLFEHNVEYLIVDRLKELEPRAWRRALLSVEAARMRRYEASIASRADLTVAVSEPDRALLAALAPRARVRVVPTGVDTTYFQPNGYRSPSARLVFVGSMDWYPNEDAVIYLIDSVLPLIRRAVPRVSVTVVGRNPAPGLRERARAAGVEVTGTVDDVRPYVGQAAVCVVPLRIGGGTRLKIFEALAMAKPVVSTSVGAEGLPLTPGEHFVLADDPREFARAVVDLLSDEARRRKLGEAGRHLVEAQYSWPAVAGEFEKHCGEVARHAS
jgi:glycosyltransferase involved in cell wall biosynthesis